MGISNYNKILRDSYPESISDFDPSKKYDAAFLDTNHILHSCGASNNILIEEKLKYKIQSFINIFNTDTFYIIIDGPAPYAKMMLQKKRRIGMTESETDSCNLIPGTKFINDMENMIKNIIDEIKKNNKYLNLYVNFSFSEIAGEGESKINNILSSMYNKKVIIVGNDADIIVMSVARIIRNKLDIDMYNNLHPLVNRISATKIIDTNKKSGCNFIFISILLGNDYLPKLKFLKVINLLEIYNIFTFDIIDYDILVKNKRLTFEGYSNMHLFFKYILKKYPDSKKKFNIREYNPEHVKNYIDGFIWCLYLYISGKCSAYDYTFNYKDSPSVVNIINYLENDISSFSIPISDSKPINHIQYPLFLMPIALVPEEYKNIILNMEKNMNTESICVASRKIDEIMNPY